MSEGVFTESGTLAPDLFRQTDDAGSAIMPSPSNGSAEHPLLAVRVSGLRTIAGTIREVELVSADGANLPAFTAGSHINLKLPGELSRSYSLTNGPDMRDRYVIAVNRDPASRGGSAYMVDKLQLDELLNIDPPHNTFPLVTEAEQSAFFAGGIGITPILSMIRHLEALQRPWRLFYAARNRASAAYLSELEALDAISPGRVHFHFDDEAGKVMPLLKLAVGIPKAAHVYCCGPKKMLEIFTASTGWRPEDNVHMEHFAGTNARPTSDFTVVLKRRNREFFVKAGESIMDVLEANGVRVPQSCREGVCGTCETVVLEGECDHKDNVLSRREKDSNKLIMICCSGARTDRLVLDI